MWPFKRSDMMLIAGLLGAALSAGAHGARADSPSLFPSLIALDGGARGASSLLPLPGAPGAGLVETPTPSVVVDDSLPAVIRPVWAETASRFVWTADTIPALAGAEPLPGLGGFAAAMREICAAAAGSLSLDASAPPCSDSGPPTAQPIHEPALPLLPAAPASPDPRALLATVALPAWSLTSPLRRRGRRIAGAVSERLSTALGLLLIVLWGTLRRR